MTIGGIELAPLLTKIQVDIKSFKTSMDEAKTIAKSRAQEISKDLEKITKVGDRLDKTGGKLTKWITIPLTIAGTASAKFAIDFESAFAGVKKTVDATDEELDALATGIRNMAKEIPASTEAIAGVAEAAGQLGIKTENILEFTRVMVDLGESTNLSAEEAASSLAKFANIAQMSQKDFGKLGSVIVDLGNNMATTERDIVDMAMRLAGSGKQIGLTEAQIMALAASLSSVGIEAEAGGSAFSRLMSNMQLAVETGSSELNEFAYVAGMSAKDFQKAFQEDAAGALVTFIEGLGNAEDKGMSAIKILDDMGITEIRLRDALLRTAGASDILSGALAIGNDAWEDNTALAKEAEQRYATTASKMAIAKNNLKDAGIVIGEVLVPHILALTEKIKNAAEWFSNLEPETQKTIIKTLALTAAIGPLLSIVGKGIKAFATLKPLLGGVNAGLGVLGKGAVTAASSTAGLSGALGTASATTGALGAGATTAGGALSGLGATFAGAASTILPIGLLIAGSALFIKSAYDEMQEDCVEDIDVLADKVQGMPGVYDEMGNAMYGVTETISDATKKAVGAYLDLDRNAREALIDLYANQTAITKDIADDMISKTDNMVIQVVNGYKKQKEDALNESREMFEELNNLTAEEQEAILSREAEYYDKKILETQHAQDRINAIYKRAAEEHRAITSEEQAEINQLQDQMQTHAIKALSEQESEANIILERMKVSNTRITTEMAAENIKKLNEQRDSAIDAANKQYLDTVEWAKKQRDELGTITDEQYEEIIKTAEQQRDDTVKAAQDTRDSAVETIMNMNADLEFQVDESSGKIKTKWQALMDKWDQWKPDVKSFDGNVTLTYPKTGRDVGINKMAEGGLAVRPHLTMIAEGGESEAVIPLSKFPSIMADIIDRSGIKFNSSNKSSSTVFNNTINIEGDADKFEVNKQIRQLMREEARLIAGAI